jgi:hypothetical protein
MVNGHLCISSPPRVSGVTEVDTIINPSTEKEKTPCGMTANSTGANL